jgi:hypothetical protein
MSPIPTAICIFNSVKTFSNLWPVLLVQGYIIPFNITYLLPSSLVFNFCFIFHPCFSIPLDLEFFLFYEYPAFSFPIFYDPFFFSIYILVLPSLVPTLIPSFYDSSSSLHSQLLPYYFASLVTQAI